MICYDKLFELMNKQGKNKTQIRQKKIISQDTLGKLNKGTGIIDIGRDPNTLLPDGKQAKKLRITAVDTKSIESLCTWLNCQPSDIMEVIPNTWDNQERLCQILNCSPEELPQKIPMKDSLLE